jgi:hemerythrin-like domain-containing protein
MADAEPQKAPGSGTASTVSGEAEPTLPKLTPSEFRKYNHMAEHMDYFHNHFRQTWTTLMTACETNKRPTGMSIRQFLSLGDQFVSHLTMHHNIEETHIFPVLAKKMPAFRKELELLSQHKQIHKGLDRLEEYLGQCRSGERELRLGEMKEVLEGFGKVLWEHLDDEVR